MAWQWHEIFWIILIQHKREGHATARTYEWLKRVNSLLKILHTKSRQSWLAQKTILLASNLPSLIKATQARK